MNSDEEAVSRNHQSRKRGAGKSTKAGQRSSNGQSKRNTSGGNRRTGSNGHGKSNNGRAKASGQAGGNGKKTLGEKDLAYFRDLLLTKRSELVGDITSMSREALQFDTATLSHYADDWADVGSDSQEQEFTLGLVESEHQLLKEISAALKRIEEGRFGVCEVTGKPIAKARLEIKPWARYCIEAARQMESSQRWS